MLQFEANLVTRSGEIGVAMHRRYNVRVTDASGMSVVCEVLAPTEIDAQSAAYSEYWDNWRNVIGEPVEVVCQLA